MKKVVSVKKPVQKSQTTKSKVPKEPTEFQSICSSLNLMAEVVYETAKSKGFHDAPVPMSESVANIHGEVSELFESYRRGTLRLLCDKAGKMYKIGLPGLTCIEEELADIIIRALDTAQEHGIDIGRAVFAKDAFNRRRPHRNGGKFA